MSPTGTYTVSRDSVIVLCKGGRLPTWHDLTQTERDAYRQEHVDLMLDVAREHELMKLEGFRLVTAQGPWQHYWVMEFPTLDGAEAWIEAEMRPPSGAHGYYEYELARWHWREGLASWPSRPRPAVVPLTDDPHHVPDLGVRTDSIVIILFGRWRPEAEMVTADVRGDDEHVELMLEVAKQHGLLRIDAFRLIAPKPDYHRAWLIEFPTLADAEAWLDAEVLPPHGRYSDKVVSPGASMGTRVLRDVDRVVMNGLSFRNGPSTFGTMRRRLFVGAFAGVAWTVALAGPALAHGDHDARPLARQLEAGPHRISLWQVYPDVGTAMTPHLIVMFEDGAVAASTADVTVAVNATPMEVRPSTTTANGWETTEGLVEGDVVRVTIADGAQAWDLDPVVVPPVPTSMLPMQELIYGSIFLTLGTAAWVAGRTARVWRRTPVRAT